MAVFKISFQQWASWDGDGREQTLAQIIAQSLAELKSVAAAG
jgi:hypothetical protein